MGEAKQRGTYKKRKTMAIERQKDEQARLKIAVAKKDHEADMREALMTAEQKRRRAEYHTVLSKFTYIPKGYFK